MSHVMGDGVTECTLPDGHDGQHRTQTHQYRNRKYNESVRTQPGTCQQTGCGKPRQRFLTGNYSTRCAEHISSSKRLWALANPDRIFERSQRNSAKQRRQKAIETFPEIVRLVDEETS